MAKPDPTWAWLIQGFDGLKPMFRFKLSRVMTEPEIVALLQRLASRDLTVSEVVYSSVRKGMSTHADLLQVRKETRPRVVLSVGNNPHYVASAHTEAEFADMKAI